MAPNTSSGALNGANSSGICPTILDAMDQPSIDGINAWFVAKAANEAGLKVALSGIGGDELLAGYPSFDDLPRWRRLLGPLAAVPGLGRLSRMMLRAVRSRASVKTIQRQPVFLSIRAAGRTPICCAAASSFPTN